MPSLVRALARRILQTVPILIGLSMIAFLLGHCAPGDPAYFALVGDGFDEPTAAELRATRIQLGLDASLPQQYSNWLSRIMRGDFGRSFRSGRLVHEEIGRRFWVTLSVALPALAATAVVGIGAGTWAGAKHTSFMGVAIDGLSSILIATPGFLIAIGLVTIVGERVAWIPVAGIGTPAHLILPVAALASGTTGVVIRLMRSAVIDQQTERYVVYARSRGQSSIRILVRHVLPNALPGALTYLANAFAGIMGGSIIIESIFALPGLGSYAVAAVLNRDLPVIQAFVLVTGVAYVAAQLVVDLLVMSIVPRSRETSGIA